ncbi:MAG: ferrochelatase [Thermoplasmata archaeon]
MAHGAVESLDDLPAYYAHVRGTPPPPALLRELTERYRAIGGRSPLNAITRSLSARVQSELDRRHGSDRYRVRVGFKHTAPFVHDVVEGMVGDGTSELLGVALAPHYSKFAIEGYQKAVGSALPPLPGALRFRMVPDWYTEPTFVAFWSDRVRNALTRLPDSSRAGARVCFTAHSLPESAVSDGDPYPVQLQEGANAIAARAGLGPAAFVQAWQSAGRTGDRWLGPDLRDQIRWEAQHGARAMVVAPHGFVCDHLEILYDIDREARQVAESVGLRLERTEMPNDDPRFAMVVADVVTRWMPPGS